MSLTGARRRPYGDTSGMANATCIVVGGGISGLSVAWRMCCDGWTVTVVDADVGPGRQATGAAGAMLGVLGECGEGDTDDLVVLRAAAGARFRPWLESVTEASGECPRGGRGTFVVADAFRRGDLAAIEAMERWSALHRIPAQRVTREDVPTRPAGDGPVLHLPEEMWVSPASLCDALRSACRRSRRVEIIPGRGVSALIVRGETVAGVVAAGQELEADEVVVCAGANTLAVLATAGFGSSLTPPLVAAKGTSGVLAEEAPLEVAVRTPNREFACGLHLLPHGPGQIYVGATNRASRFPALLDRHEDDEVAVLAAGAGWLWPGRLPGRFRASSYGHRVLAADGWPIAGRTEVPGLSVVTAGYRNGILLAPLLADAAADDIADRARLNDLSPSAVRRRRPPCPSPMSVLEAGLEQLARFREDAPDEGWGEVLGRAKSRLDGLFVRHPSEDAPELALLRRYPLVEMVPELLVEMADDPLREGL
jgi:glycine oxidase